MGTFHTLGRLPWLRAKRRAAMAAGDFDYHRSSSMKALSGDPILIPPAMPEVTGKEERKRALAVSARPWAVFSPVTDGPSLVVKHLY
jgi:hypothetical protein